MASPPSDRLVGRQRELACVHDLVKEVARGAPANLLIEGEAGIGKSRLVRSLIDLARDAGVAVFRGDAHPFERTRPFGPVARALDLRVRSLDHQRASIGRLLADDSEVADANASVPFADVRYRVVEEILDIVETSCARGPVLIVLEDLHWADESTLFTFRSMLHGLVRVPLLLVGSMRPSPRSADFDQLLDESLLSNAQLLRLEPLTPRRCRRLGAGRARAATWTPPYLDRRQGRREPAVGGRDHSFVVDRRVVTSGTDPRRSDR